MRASSLFYRSDLVRALALAALLVMSGCDSPNQHKKKHPTVDKSEPASKAKNPHSDPQPEADPLAVSRAYVNALPETYPKIVPTKATGTTHVVSSFLFEGKPLRVELDANNGALEGARTAQRDVTYPVGERPSDLEARGNVPYVVDAAQDSFFEAILIQFRTIRADQKLDDDRYYELLTAFVQNIPYDTHGKAGGRFPLEVVVDNTGDCDEKSRLLAGLAAREGYAVALLTFDTEQHMAVGIKADELTFRTTGYAYTEATLVSPVTNPFADTDTLDLKSTPSVIPIGSGQKRYRAAADIRYLVDTRASLTQMVDEENRKIAKANTDMAALNADANRLARKLNARGASRAIDTDSLKKQFEKITEQQRTLDAESRQMLARATTHVSLANLYNDPFIARVPLVQRLRDGLAALP